MFVEQYSKSKGGRPYFTVYFRFGQVEVSVRDIKADDKESARLKAIYYLKRALE